MARRFCELLPDYPGGYDGRGVVVCAGGAGLFTCGYVCARMLRFVGCRLPIQFWHLGAREMDGQMRDIAAELGAVCVDAEAVRGLHPARILNGWELKPFAALHAPFREVLLLDADNVAVRDPEYLFESPEYQRHGAIFWPDFGRMDRSRSIWDICDVEYRDEPEIESGQILIDKKRCWKALRLALWLNEHSDYYYAHIHGDKGTFQMAWHMLNQPYAMPPFAIEALDATMCQHDFLGRRLFQHRNMDKWRFDGSNRRVPGFLFEEQCRNFLAELRTNWSGVVGPASTVDAAYERALAREVDRCLKGCDYQPGLFGNQETLIGKYRMLWAIIRALGPKGILQLGMVDGTAAGAIAAANGEVECRCFVDGSNTKLPMAELLYIGEPSTFLCQRRRMELGLTARPRWIYSDHRGPGEGPLAGVTAFCDKWADLVRAAVTLEYRGGRGLLIELRDVRDEHIEQLRAEAAQEREMESSWYIYRRVGHDERPMELGSSGIITEGAGDCENSWQVDLDRSEKPVLTIAGEKGPTCNLRWDDGSQIWRGRWLHYERMLIELVPVR
jgi:hypothetical protein